MSTLNNNVILPGGVIIRNIFYPKKFFSSSTLRIILTTDCNYSCVYCYAEGEENKNHRTLSLNDIISVLEVAKEIGIKNVKLTGGEPLCYPELEGLLSYLSDYFNYDITTNASLLSPQKIDLLNKYHVGAINISLNSVNEIRYRKLSQSNSYSSVFENLEYAADHYNGSIRINSIVFDDVDTFQDYNSIISFCKDKNFNLRFIEPTIVKELPITHTKYMFSSFLENTKQNALRTAISEGGQIEYIFGENGYITFLHSMCDNHLCENCKKYMYIRLTSDLKFKPCLSRRDNEISIDMSSTNSIREAYLQLIEAWINE